jgi:general secretion pathway protein B
MSFILDALKKSESDRQRQSGPSLFEVKVAPPRRTLPIWAVAIAVLLGINVIVVSWMLLRRPAAPQPAAAPTAAAPGGSPPAAIPAATGPMARTAQRAPASAALPQAPPAAGTAPSTPAAPPPSAASASSSSGPPGAAASPPPHSAGAPAANDQNSGPPAAGGDPSDYAPAVEPAEAGGAGTGGGSADDGALPLYQQIVDSAGLPALHLDLHVFADRPRDRFVMINMHRLGEGDSLPEGVHVDSIRPDGVVLTFHGKRFLLPRN